MRQSILKNYMESRELSEEDALDAPFGEGGALSPSRKLGTGRSQRKADAGGPTKYIGFSSKNIIGMSQDQALYMA